MKSFVYRKFSDLYLNNNINLDNYINSGAFRVALFKSKYSPNLNQKSYFDIKSAECNDHGYNAGGKSIVVTKTNGKLYGSDVSWYIDISDIRYAILYLKTTDSNNGLLLSCYDFDSQKSYNGQFTLSWNGVELLSIVSGLTEVDKYVVDLDTDTIYTPDEDYPDDVYKGITEKKLYVEYSDSSKAQLTLISLAGKIDEDPDDDESIDNDSKDLIPDFVSYKVFEKYAKEIDKLNENFGNSTLSFIGIIDGYDNSEVKLQTWLETHNNRNYHKGDAIIVSVKQINDENPVSEESLDMWVVTSADYDSIKSRVLTTPNDMFVCISDAIYTVNTDEITGEQTKVYKYQKSDWKFVNSNTTDITSQETVTAGNIPVFDSTGKLLSDSNISVEHSGDYLKISAAEPNIVVSGVLSHRNESGLPVEYLLKDKKEIRPLDPEEAILALGLSIEENLFDRLTDAEISAIKAKVDAAYNALGESGMALTTATIASILEENNT